MSKFVYEGVTHSGRRITGEYEGPNEKQVTKELLKQLMFVISLKPYLPVWLDWMNADATVDKIKKADLADFLIQMGAMVESGIEVPAALASIAKFGEKGMQRLAVNLNLEIMEGKNLAEAFKANEKMVGGEYDKFIQVGIDGGGLARVLRELGENLERSGETTKKISGALMYPCFMFLITIFISIYLFVSVIPNIASSVSDMSDGPLPMLTQVVLAISAFMIKYGIYLGIVVAALVAALVWALKNPLKAKWHKFTTKVPIMGKIIINREMAAFYRALNISAGAGMPYSEAYMCSAKGINNIYINEVMISYGKLMEEDGYSLSAALEDCPFVSGIEIQSLEVGTKTSKLDEMATACAKRIDSRNDVLIKRFTTILEPMMLLVIGGLIGVIMMAIYLPIFSVMDTM